MGGHVTLRPGNQRSFPRSITVTSDVAGLFSMPHLQQLKLTNHALLAPSFSQSSCRRGRVVMVDNPTAQRRRGDNSGDAKSSSMMTTMAGLMAEAPATSL